MSRLAHQAEKILLDDHVPNAFSVDVEDYFQVSAFKDRVCRSQWDQFDCRVEANTNSILQLMEDAQIRGTFFILGWVADRYPGLVDRIARHGHEIASHGYWHQLVYELTPEEFAKDISDSCDAIGNACGVRATSYRAPSFSIVGRSIWALDILAELGITLDSSIFPISGHDLYGIADSPQQIHTRQTKNGPICEFPPSVWTAASWKRPAIRVPVGGGYFRLFPLSLTNKAIRHIRRSGRPAMFYIHPWEVDAQQPRIGGTSLKSRFRHYTGLAATTEKLRRLIARNPFGAVADVIQATGSSKV